MSHPEELFLDEAFAETERVGARSPYPALQAILPRLAALNPHPRRRPIFDDREDAEVFIESEADNGRVFALIPVWAVNHMALERSEIHAWSVTRHPC